MDDMITYGPVFVNNINEDFDLVQRIVERDYTSILRDPDDRTFGEHPIKKPGVLWCAPSPKPAPLPVNLLLKNFVVTPSKLNLQSNPPPPTDN